MTDAPLPARTIRYPNKPSPGAFSPSALKRKSIQDLKSISWIQHQFTKLNVLDLEGLPPSPIPPDAPPIVTFPDLGLNKRPDLDAVSSLEAMQAAFELVRSPGSLSPAAPSLDILHLLRASTKAIRDVRTYVASLPEETSAGDASPRSPAGSGFLSPPAPKTLRSQSSSSSIRPILPHHTFSTPSRPSQLGPSSRRVSSSPSPNTVASQIRKSGVDLLAQLRKVEERYRLDGPSPRLDSATPSSFICTPPSSRSSSPAPSSVAPTSSRRTSLGAEWDERDRDDYQGGLSFASDEGGLLADARDAASAYLALVDELLFGSSEVDGERAWSRVHSGPRRKSVAVDPELRRMWMDRTRPPLGRAWAILRDKLPSRPLDDRPSLSLLSDGYLISLAHNAIVKDSASPWGYIPANTIHGPLDGDNRTDRIFTRAENLTTWAATVRLRYATPLAFSAQRVARKEDGWEEELERAMTVWLDAVAHEEDREGVVDEGEPAVEESASQAVSG